MVVLREMRYLRKETSYEKTNDRMAALCLHDIDRGTGDAAGGCGRNAQQTQEENSFREKGTVETQTAEQDDEKSTVTEKKKQTRQMKKIIMPDIWQKKSLGRLRRRLLRKRQKSQRRRSSRKRQKSQKRRLLQKKQRRLKQRMSQKSQNRLKQRTLRKKRSVQRRF